MVAESLPAFAVLPKWFEMLKYLEGLAIKEDWNYKVPQLDRKNQNNPILENYIHHTFRRLVHEWNAATPENKNRKIYINDSCVCFNTGLFTKNYKYIYAYFEKNRTPGDTREWWLKGFFDDVSPYLEDIHPLPIRAKYIEDITDLIYDTNLELRVNSAHILENPKNRERIPEKVRDLPNLPVFFDGAITLAIKKIESNYKIAVPQYYQEQMQFLIPISLIDMQTVDLALAVTKKNGHYTGSTCLTMDMAYNNARLIAKPDSDWLKP